LIIIKMTVPDSLYFWLGWPRYALFALVYLGIIVKTRFGSRYTFVYKVSGLLLLYCLFASTFNFYNDD
jgi:hypothetical protein